MNIALCRSALCWSGAVQSKGNSSWHGWVVGGVLHTNPPGSQFIKKANASGRFSAAVAWPPGVTPGTDVFLQFIVQDLSVPDGITLSNGVMATTP